MEARALAEHAIPGLERVRGVGVFNKRLDSRAQLVHFFEVREIHDVGQGQRFALLTFQIESEHLADQRGPAIVDQIDFLRLASD